MGHNTPSSAYDDEFPLLRSNGLYAAAISGDGDCLFHALSDQLYGHENCHRELRAAVVSHMRHHADYYKQFLSVPHQAKKSGGGGGDGGVTKGGRGRSNTLHQAPSKDAIDDAFQQHLRRMAQQGVYGDNLEICAFAREFDCDVKIYQREFAYVVTGGDGSDKEGGRKMLHIAYHTWEHYSSIRNIAGPHTGLPGVSPVVDPRAAAGAEKEMKKGKYVLPWMVKTVMDSLPFLATEEDISHMLESCKGDVNEAVERLLMKDSHADLFGCDDEEAEQGEDEKPPTPPPTPPPATSPHKKGKPASTTPKTSPVKNLPKTRRDREREAKERQKENKKKARGDAAAASKSSSSKKGEISTSKATDIDDVVGGIRELYI